MKIINKIISQTKLILIPLLGVGGLGLLSCETILDDIPASRLPKIEQKLVLASFISPQDTAVIVRVTRSTPLFTDYLTNRGGFSVNGKDTTFFAQSNVVNDAKVTLSADNQDVTLKYDTKNEWYFISQKEFKIIGGKTYTLKAESKDLKAEATCTVPLDQIKIDSYAVDSTEEVDLFRSRKGFQFSLKWTDIKAKANLYRVRASLEYEILSPRFGQGNQVIYTPLITYSNITWDNEFNSIKAYLSDENVDGNKFTSPLGRAFLSANGSVSINGVRAEAKLSDKRPILTLELLNIDPNYAEYHKSIIRHEIAEDNPFAEPAPVFTNVKNGLGCFGASNRSVVVVKL